MHLPNNQMSRSRATFAGAIAGTVSTLGAAAVYVLATPSSSVTQVDNGLAGSSIFMLIIPGSLFIGLIFALPTSATMVFSLTALSQKAAFFDKAMAWIVVGALCASPTAWLFSNLDTAPPQIALASIWSGGLAAGAITGLAAWTFRHRKQQHANFS